MIKKIVLITLILTLVLVGCQTQEEKEAPTPREPIETADISIEADISEIDSLNEDLSLDELENLEQELDEINW